MDRKPKLQIEYGDIKVLYTLIRDNLLIHLNEGTLKKLHPEILYFDSRHVYSLEVLYDSIIIIYNENFELGVSFDVIFDGDEGEKTIELMAIFRSSIQPFSEPYIKFDIVE